MCEANALPLTPQQTANSIVLLQVRIYLKKFYFLEINLIYGIVMGHVCNKSLCDVKEANSDVEIGKQNNKPCVVCIKGSKPER